MSQPVEPVVRSQTVSYTPEALMLYAFRLGVLGFGNTVALSRLQP